MKTIRPLLLCLALSALLPAAAAAQTDTDFRLGHNFTGVKTFSFGTGESGDKTRGSTTYDSPLIMERTNAAVAAELERRGLRRDDRNPDLYVTARRSFHKETVVYPDYTWGVAYPYSWGWPYGYASSAYAYEIVVGTLTVDLSDAASGQLLWRGTTEKRVHQTSSPERRTRRVNKEVTKVFEDFPLRDASHDD
jgi:hypothetical protein